MPRTIKYNLKCDNNNKTPDRLTLIAAAAVLKAKKLELIAAAAVITAKNQNTPKTT